MEGYRVLEWPPPAGERQPLVPDQFNMVTTLVDRHLHQGHGERVAVYYPAGQLTYAELASLVNRTGNLLGRLGVAIEERVALLLPDSPQFLATFLGAMKIGAVPVPLNLLATADDLHYYLSDSRARVVVLDADCLDRLRAVRARLPALRHVLLVGPPQPDALPFDELVARESDALEAAATSADDMAYWLYSSGTTGRPKGVVHLHRDMVYCTSAYAEQVVRLTPDDRSFSASKLFFSYGLVNSLYLPLWTGSAVILNPLRPEPATLLATIERYRPTVFYSVPTSYAQLIRELEARGAVPEAVRALRLCVSAGEPLPAPIYERWRALTGVEVLDGVGSTEVGYIYISNRPGRSRPGTSGELLAGYAARLVDEEGHDVPPGEPGDLWIAAPSTAARYWHQHDRTRQTMVGPWLKTGDKYVRDADGYYVYAGRSDDMLKVGGIWVSPMEVEAALLAHPAVAECAVVGLPDANGLVKPKAYVVPRGEPSPTLVQELQEWVKGRLAPYKYPRAIEFVAELPKTATGKIQRYRLRTGS